MAATERKVIHDFSEGIDPNTIVVHSREIADHKEKMKSAQGKFRAARKRMEESGVDGKAFDLAMTLQKLDPAEAILRLNRAIYILQAVHAPVGSQLSFMTMGDPNSPVSDAEREKRWFDEGFNACLSGKTEVDCPHALNLPSGQKWLAGFREATSIKVTEKSAEELASQNPIDEIGQPPKKRGRPAGSRNKPKGAESGPKIVVDNDKVASDEQADTASSGEEADAVSETDAATVPPAPPEPDAPPAPPEEDAPPAPPEI